MAIASNQTRLMSKLLYPFLVGILFPLLLYIAFVLMAFLLDFITVGTLDARKAIPHFLQVVKFEEGTKRDYWVVNDAFFFSLEKRKNKGFFFSFYPNFATWILVSVVGLYINVVFSFFTDLILDMQVTANSCDAPQVDSSFTCFNASDFSSVDCISNPTLMEQILCFKFLSVRFDQNFLNALATTYAFYLIVSSAFGLIFTMIQLLLTLFKNRIWGVILVAGGGIAFLVFISLIIIWIIELTSSLNLNVAQLNLAGLLQLVMGSWFMILPGLLVVKGKWAEKKPTRVIPLTVAG